MTNYATNLKPKYVLGNVLLNNSSTHIGNTVFSFSSLLLGNKKTGKNLYPISIFENFIDFSPLKGETDENIQLKNMLKSVIAYTL